MLDACRGMRDGLVEQIFLATYSSPLLQAITGLRNNDAPHGVTQATNQNEFLLSQNVYVNCYQKFQMAMPTKLQFVALYILEWLGSESMNVPLIN